MSASEQGTADKRRTHVVQWILDTRDLWPEAAQTKQLPEHAKRALDLLPRKDRDDVLRYVHVRDAKMALGSRLLKRYLISRHADVPWSAAEISHNADTKPVYVAPDGSEPLIFNVSHQAGIVALVGAVDAPHGAAVGVDVVCPPERRERDRQMIRAEGWRSFVDIHDEVFSREDVESLYGLPFGADEADRRLRYFYTVWCLREAYVKMTGEALLAPWLKQLEMRGFAPPEDDAGSCGTEIWFRGRRVEDVDLDLVSVLDSYMICTATKRDEGGGRLDVGEWQMFDLEEALDFAEKSTSAL